jgi:sensor histidine kinase YesM
LRVSRKIAAALLVFAASTAWGLYFAAQLRFDRSPSVTPSWGSAVTINLVYYYAWGAAVPLVIMLARRFRFDTGSWRKSVVGHLLGGAALTCLQVSVAAIVLVLFSSVASYQTTLVRAISRGLTCNFQSSYPTYWVILFAYLSFDYYAKYRDRELQAAQLQTRLAEARLQALRLQLNPHFLFNTLNSISSLMYTDVVAADAMMTRLSELLRLTLESDGRQEVSLRQELEMLQRYVEIETIRFEDRLRVSMDVEDGTLEARVPVLSLQPLVENAIRHAIAPRTEGGRLQVTARRDNGSLRITVVDDGPGLSPGRFSEGIGLANTRARLAQLYGGDQRLELTSRPEGGLEVALTIPFRLDQDAGQSADQRSLPPA